MDLNPVWYKPLPVEDDSKNNGVYTVNLNAILTPPGIYIFLRSVAARA